MPENHCADRTGDKADCEDGEGLQRPVNGLDDGKYNFAKTLAAIWPYRRR
jgi:hypothetical protein